MTGTVKSATWDFDKTYETNRKTVFFTIRRLVQDRGIAEDLSQEVFIRAWQKAHLYDPARGSLPTWLRTLAHNAAVSHLRGAQAVRWSDVSWQTSTVFRNGWTTGELAITWALDKLTSRERMLLTLGFFEGMSHAEIAHYLDWPLGTVKSRMRDAIRLMRLRVA